MLTTRRTRRTGAAALLAGLLVATGASAGGGWTQDFDDDAEGWVSRVRDRTTASAGWRPDGGRDGTGCLEVRATADLPRRFWQAWFLIDGPPKGEALRISAWVRGENVKYGFRIRGEAQREGPDRIAWNTETTAETEPVSGIFDWTRIETTLVIPHNVGQAQFQLVLDGGGDVQVDDVTIETVRRSLPPAPGLVRVISEVTVESQSWQPSSRFRVPLPGVVDGASAPVALRLVAEPIDALANARVITNPDGKAFVQLELSNVSSTRPVRLRMTAIVLAGPEAFKTEGEEPGPDAAPDWKKTVLPWLNEFKWAREDGAASRAQLGESRLEVGGWRHIDAPDDRWKQAIVVATAQWKSWLNTRPALRPPFRPFTNGVAISAIDHSDLQQVLGAIEQ